MKKTFLFLLIILCGFVLGVQRISAMTEKELEKKLTQSYKVNGEYYSIDSDAKVLAERYLNQYEVSSKDADYIGERIDEAVKLIQDCGIADMKKMPKQTKEELKKLVEKVSANTSVKATVMKNSVVVYAPTGDKFAEVDKLVKQTGIMNLNLIVISISLFIILSSILYFKKVIND